MTKILIGNKEILLTRDIQISPNGREFKHSGVQKVGEGKWINKVEKWHWIYSFIYVDNQEVFGFEFDYFDNFVRKV